MSGTSLILVINCGSSSLKFSVLPVNAEQPVISGLAERLGLDNAIITFKDSQGNKTDTPLPHASHTAALQALFEKLKQLRLAEYITAIGHRVAHGGNEFKNSVLITPDVLEKINALSVLAPLHNPANVMGIEAAQALLPDIAQVAVFDTAFHQTLPPAAYTYALPWSYQQQYQVRRYGFHGTSHRYIAREALTRLKLCPNNHGLLIAHLGNGSSVCAVQNGHSVDTSMGMTPLEGLVMGTRCGDLDLGAAVHIAHVTGQSLDEIWQMANSASGLYGLSGISSDCRTLQEARANGDTRAGLAIDVMVHRLARHLGGHLTALTQFDALIFTGGIGENSALVRELTIKRLAVLGLEIDSTLNAATCGGRAGIISPPGAPVIAVIPTNEEKMIAQDAADIACQPQADTPAVYGQTTLAAHQ